MSFLRRGRAKNKANAEETPRTHLASEPQSSVATAPTFSRPVVIPPSLREWMAQTSWAASRAWLAAHEHDLPAESVAILKAAALDEPDPHERERLDLHAYLLMATRREGLARAYDGVFLPSALLPPSPPPPAPEAPPEVPEAIWAVDEVAPPAAPQAAPQDELAVPVEVPPTPEAAPVDAEAIAEADPAPQGVASTPEAAVEPLVAPPLAPENTPTDEAPPPAPMPTDEAIGSGESDDDASTALDAVLLALAVVLGEPAAMQALLREHAAQLVTPTALERSRALLADAQTSGDAARVERLTVVADIVERLQEVSPEELATAEVSGDARPQSATALVIAWLQTPDWTSSREFLSAHSELLSDETDAILARLAEREGDERVRETLAEHQRLLALCRAQGIAEGYRRFLEERRAARQARRAQGRPGEGVAVPPDARLAAQNALSNPQLREMLSAPVIEALQGLLAPAPTPEELSAGMNALVAVDIALERAYLQGVLTRLNPMLWEWWSTPTWPASRAWLDTHLGELPPNAPTLLRQAAEEVRARGMEGSAVSCERHADLVDSAWREGVDAAYRALVGEDAFVVARDEDLSQLVSQLTAWVNTADWSTSHDYLAAHDSLLSTRAEGALALLADTQSGNSRAILEDHQRLLALCRAYGVEEGYQRFLAMLRAERLERMEAMEREQAAGSPAAGAGPVALPAGVRDLVERLLTHPEGVPEPVLEALRPLLGEKPSQEQVSRGLAALAALGAMASRRHARALLAKRSAALVAWYETPTWAASRTWLNAHLAEVPEDAPALLRAAAKEARADGDETSAEAMERHIALIEAARRDGVDAAYRAIVGEDAFAEDASATGPGVVRTGQQVEDWIRQPDWEDSRAYLRTHPNILSDEGTRALDMLQRAQHTDESHQIVTDHERLQSLAREQGVEAAYDAFLAELARTHRPRGKPLNREIERRLIEWLQTPTWDASRAYLTGHAELLSDAGEAGLASLVDIQSNAQRRRTVAAHQRLLALCRRVGITDGYFRFFDAPPEPSVQSGASQGSQGSPQDVKAEDDEADTTVPPDARELALRLLAEPDDLPPDVLDALRDLLTFDPTPEQVERGLAALAAVIAVASADHARGLLARRSPLLAEWFATDSWPESRAWLNAHLGALPEDAPALLRAAAEEARADGDEVGAEHLARHAALVERARGEGVDAAYRAVVGGDAFGEEASVSLDVKRLAQVGQQVEDWVRTPDWGASRDYLRVHPDILTETGAVALRMLYEAQDADGPRQVIADHQRLWDAARTHGIDVAYDTFLADLAQRERRQPGNAMIEMGRLLIDWMRTPTWDASRAYLADHPEIATEEGERTLAQLHDIQSVEGARQEIRRHQRLLAYCRAMGLDAGYERFLAEEKHEATE